jgi:hypothetical protein
VTLNPTPWAMDGAEVDAKLMRQAMGSLIGAAGGLAAAGALEVSQNGAGSMSCVVKGGKPSEGGAWVAGTSVAESQGPYWIWNESNTTLTINTANGSNPRIETIIARIEDAQFAGSNKKAVLQVVEGTATSGATLENLSGKGTVPASSLVLAYVLVPAGASSILTADIKQVATVFQPSAPMGGVQSSIIATEQERESTSFGKLSTPDEVTVTIPTGGVIAVAAHVTWKSSVSAAGRVALFVGANQLKNNAATPAVAEEGSYSTVFSVFSTSPESESGFVFKSNSGSYTGDVTTGQLLGAPVLIFGLAAGSYPISLQYRATSGKVTVKQRSLWAWAL